jgi:hypothetical protein
MGYNPYDCMVCKRTKDNGWEYGRECICNVCFELLLETHRAVELKKERSVARRERQRQQAYQSRRARRERREQKI